VELANKGNGRRTAALIFMQPEVVLNFQAICKAACLQLAATRTPLSVAHSNLSACSAIKGVIFRAPAFGVRQLVGAVAATSASLRLAFEAKSGDKSPQSKRWRALRNRVRHI